MDFIEPQLFQLEAGLQEKPYQKTFTATNLSGPGYIKGGEKAFHLFEQLLHSLNPSLHHFIKTNWPSDFKYPM